MLKPVEMVKVCVVGPKDHFRSTAETLHRLNVLHIEDYTGEEEYFEIGTPLEEASRLSRFVVTLRSLLSYVKLDGVYEPKKVYSVSELSQVAEDKVSELESTITSKIDEMREIEDRLRRIADEKRLIEPLIALGLPPELLSGYRNLTVFVGFIRSDPLERIMEVTQDFERFIAEFEREQVVAVFVKNEDANDVLRVLQELGWREISVPISEGSFQDKLAELDREEVELREKLEKLRAEIEALEMENLDLMLALEEHLSIELEKCELPLKAATSKYAFIIVGYIPREKFETFKQETEKNRVVVLEIKDRVWKPPTAFKNPAVAKPFELLTTSFSIPKYTEIDPTTVMAFFFPVFFGFMLGDIGYGVILIGLSLWLSRIFKTEGWQSLLRILLYSGISTVLFGLGFGEFFGFELFGHESILGGEFAHMEPILGNRLYDAPKLLVVTLAVAVIHMGLGFIFGIRNVAKEHGWKHAIEEKFNWFLALISIAFIITGFILNTLAGIPVFSLNFAYIAALPLIVVWAVLTVMGEGAMFLIEYLTLLSNTISYARLLAVGLASVGFAIAFNKIAFEMLMPAGMVGLIIGVIILALGHFINLLLGILDPGLQSLRLHYVEFFVKFFEGGGIRYNPFGRIRKYTKEEV